MKQIRIVADMTADLFHAGHVSFLRGVKNYFSPAEGGSNSEEVSVHLTVALHTDEQIYSFKGRYPVMNYVCRMEVLRSCVWVDQVMEAPDVYDQTFVDSFDHLAHGDDLVHWEAGLFQRFYGLWQAQGKLLMIPYTEGISSTQLRQKAQNLSS